MNVFAVVAITSAAVALFAGSFVFSKSPRSALNVLFLLVAISVSYFSVAAFGQIQADDLEEATQWSKFSAFWPFIYALVLHLALVFAQRNALLRQPFTYVVIYLPAVVFSILEIGTTTITPEPTLESWGWSAGFTDSSMAAYLAAGWSLVIGIVAEFLLVWRYRTAPDPQARQQAKFAILGSVIPLVAGVFDGLLPSFGVELPNTSVPSFAIGCVFIGYGIWRHGLFLLKPEVVADELLATLNDPLILVDPLGQIVHVNPATVAMSGFDESELVGESYAFLYTDMIEDGSSPEGPTLIDFVRRGVSGESAAWMNARTGRKIPVTLSISVLRDNDGEYIGLICNGRDITEKQQKQEEITSLQRRIESILESAGDGIIGLDRKGAATFVNRAASDITGWDVDDLNMPAGYQRLYGNHSTEAHADSPIALTLRDGNHHSVNDHFLHKDGKQLSVACRITPMLDDRGGLAGAVVVFRDTTALKQAEAARIDRAALAARSDELQLSRIRIVEGSEKLRRDMAAHLHGSVQNRLIVLLHRLNEIESVEPKQQIAERLEAVHDNLSRILNNDLRRITQQLFPSILRRGLSTALESLVDRFGDTLNLRVELDTGLTSHENDNAEYIPGQVKLSAYRIVEEALMNALKHAEASEVVVTAIVTQDNELKITASDNGKGFDPKQHKDGLGLGTMSDYAEVVGGTVTIGSETGSGTVVQTELPLSDPAGAFDFR